MFAKSKTPKDNKHNGPGSELPRVGHVPLSVNDSPDPLYDEAEISLNDIWRILRRYRALVLGIVLLAGLLTYAATLMMLPVYRADVVLMPVVDPEVNDRHLSPFSDFGNIAALAGINPGRQDRKNESIATLKSRRFNEQFIRDNKLKNVLFADLWDEKKQRWEVEDEADIPSLWDAYEVFDDTVRRIREDRSTGLVTLSIEWTDPELAAEWANKLVLSVNDTLRQQAGEASNKAIAYLQEQLDRTSVVELQQVLHRLIEAEMKKIILANITEEFAFKVIDPAIAPEEAIKPRPLSMVLLATLLSLIGGVVLAFIINAVGNDSRRRES